MAAGLALQTPRLRVLLSLDSLAERALPSTEVNRRVRAAYATGNELGIIVAAARPGAALTPDQVEKLGDWVAKERRADPEVVGVLSPFDLTRVRARGMFALPVPRVAFGTREEMQDLAGSPWGGILTDRDGRDLGVQLELRDTPGGSRYGRFDPATVGRVERRLRHDVLEGDSLRAFLVGPAAFEYYSLQGIRRFRVLNVAMLVLILVLLRVWLGTWRSGALMTGIVLLVGLGVAGAMATAGHPIDLLSTGLFLILAVAALEDFLFLSYLRASAPVSWRRAFRVMLVPSFLTSLTTVIGFWSLCLSDLAIVRRLGMWAGVGAAAEWVAMFVVLPALLVKAPRWRTWTDPRRAWRTSLPARLAVRSMPRGLALGLLTVHVLAAYGALHLERNDSIPRLFDPHHPYARGFEYLRGTRGYQGSVSVVLPGAADRAASEAVLARIAALPGVAQVLSPYAVIDDARGVAPAGPVGSAAPDPEDLRRLPGFFAADGSLRALVYLRRVDLVPLQRTLAELRRTCAGRGGEVAGELVTYAEFADRVPSTLYRSLGSCLLLVGLILFGLLAACAQPRPWLVVLASFWGPAATMVVLWALRLPLNFITCIFASVLVGLTGDNVIQYLFAAGRGDLVPGISRRGGAAILVATFMALACLIFLGSAFVPSRRVGGLIAFGFIASLAGDLWILRSLLGAPRRPPRPAPGGPLPEDAR